MSAMARDSSVAIVEQMNGKATKIMPDSPVASIGSANRKC
jgi:hypothetical protein